MTNKATTKMYAPTVAISKGGPDAVRLAHDLRGQREKLNAELAELRHKRLSLPEDQREKMDKPIGDALAELERLSREILAREKRER